MEIDARIQCYKRRGEGVWKKHECVITRKGIDVYLPGEALKRKSDQHSDMKTGFNVRDKEIVCVKDLMNPCWYSFVVSKLGHAEAKDEEHPRPKDDKSSNTFAVKTQEIRDEIFIHLGELVQTYVAEVTARGPRRDPGGGGVGAAARGGGKRKSKRKSKKRKSKKRRSKRR